MALEHINSWSQRAKCRGDKSADKLFFPPTGGAARRDNEVGKRFCTDCPVRSQCKIYAIAHNVYGIWGGTTKAERDRLSKFTRLAIQTMYIEAGQLEPLVYHEDRPRLTRTLPQAAPDPISHVDREMGPILSPVLEENLPCVG